MGKTITCTRSIGFDTGHRLVGHEGKCASLHGHRYTAEVTCEGDEAGPELDGIGRVIDFSKVKELVGGWIDTHWDHTMVLRKDDPFLSAAMAGGEATVRAMFGPRPPFMFDVNPTAENMAAFLWRTASELLAPHGIRVTQVRLYETPNCWADYTPSPPQPDARPDPRQQQLFGQLADAAPRQPGGCCPNHDKHL